MTLRARTRLALIGAVLLLSACGGGGGAGSAVPITGGSSGSKPQAAQAAVSFFVPSAPSTAAARRPGYLPSNTQSVVISVNNADGSPLIPAVAPTIANVSSTAPGCSAVAGGVQCTITVATDTGSINFSISAYDGPNGTGNILSTGTISATIGSGPNTLSIALGNTSIYTLVTMSGGIGKLTIDHQGHTITAQQVTGNTFTSNGTYTVLPNGVYKIVITSSTDPTTLIGEVIYARELSNGMVAFVATGATTPSADGSSTSNADWGVGTLAQSCQTSGTFNFAGGVIEGQTWTSASSTAYTIGTATITSSGLNFVGTNYLFSGTSKGGNTGATAPCSNGVYTETQGGAILGVQGMVVVSNNTGQGGNTSDTTGEIGFNPGSLTSPPTLNLSAIASQTYDVFQADQGVSGGMTFKFESPELLTPAGGNSMTGCQYTNFEANVVGTSNCTTITLTGQIGPGLISGTASNPNSGTSPFVAVAGQINGKYVFDVVSSSTGAGVNIIAIQH